MVCKLTVSHSLTKENLFEKEFSSKEEMMQLPGFNEKSRIKPIFNSVCFVVRIENSRVFFRDLFFPTLSSYLIKGLKKEKVWEQLIEESFLIILDLNTFIIRIATLLFRYLHSYPKTAHPFYQYLVKEGVAREKLDQEQVEIECKEKEEIFDQKGRKCLRLQESLDVFYFTHYPQTQSRNGYSYCRRIVPIH